ncbi:MAG: hypothetical protein J7L12_03410 [Desulfurococcales archaeon]|nr:hypothetical protein [Desulfurococcales archaeon]
MYGCTVENVVSVLLTATVVAVAVGNNMGVIAGPSSGVKVISKNWLYILAIIGLSLGYFCEGWKVRITAFLQLRDMLVIFSIAILILSLLTLMGFVTSVTQIFMGVLIGYTIAVSGQSLLIGKIAEILMYWGLTLVLSATTSFLLMKILFGGRTIIIKNLGVFKLVIALLVVFTAYVLGANTLGFIVSFTMLGMRQDSILSIIAVLAGIVIGVVIVRGIRGTHRIGMGFYGLRYSSTLTIYISALVLAEVGTQLSIPIPLSLAVFSGLLGSSMGMKLRLIKGRKVVEYLLASWIVPLIISLIASYTVFYILREMYKI